MGWLPTHWLGGFTTIKREAGSLLGYLTAGGKSFLLRESGTVVLLLTKCCFCPLLSHAAALTMLHTKSFPRQFGGCSPALMREMQHRVMGLRITECHSSAVRSMFRHFASCFRDSPPVRCAISVSPTKALQQGPGCAVQWVVILPRPCCGAQAVLYSGCTSCQGPAKWHRRCGGA